MKKVISLTIALCLTFGAVLPVYAEAWTSTEAQSVTSDVRDINDNIEALFRAFTATGTMYNSISEMMSWLTPAGSFSTSHSITGVTLYEVVDYIAWTLSGVGPTVYDTFQSMGSMLAYMPSVDSRLSTANTNLNDLELGLTNYFRDAESVNVANRKLNTHTALVNSALEYKIKNINSSNVISEETLDWQNGSPLGNIAVILHRIANNDTTGLGLFLDHTVGTTFGIWDSRTNNIPMESPNAWTPYSAIHGLYTYLAYLQRDVALMSWVVSNPSDLIIRQDSEDLTNGYYDNFVDPDSDNTFTRSEMDDVGGLASDFKDNFSTGQSAGNVFSIFTNGSSTNWFSQATKNALDQRQTRATRSSSYDTPLLDAYYEEIMTYFPGGDQ